MDLESALSTLFSTPLADFIAKRKELATALKRAGQKEAAQILEKTQKPQPTAWAVNQLVQRAPAELEALFRAGEELRDVQKKLLDRRASSQDFAAAREQQKRAVHACTAIALDLLEDGASSATAARIEKTLDVLATRGEWDGPPGRLTRDLEELQVDALAALLGVSADPSPTPPPKPAPAPAPAAERPTHTKEPKATKRESLRTRETESDARERAEREAREQAEREAKQREAEAREAREREQREREQKEREQREREAVERRARMQRVKAARRAHTSAIQSLETKRRDTEEQIQLLKSRIIEIDQAIEREKAALDALPTDEELSA